MAGSYGFAVNEHESVVNCLLDLVARGILNLVRQVDVEADFGLLGWDDETKS
jgi:hypothetical protein